MACKRFGVGGGGGYNDWTVYPLGGILGSSLLTGNNTAEGSKGQAFFLGLLE